MTPAFSARALTQQATLMTDRLRLEQLGPAHFPGTWAALADEESNRLTGTHATFTPEAVRDHLGRLPGRADRADWAVVRQIDGAHVGEAVLNELDPDNLSMNYRILLFPDGGQGQGFGVEVTRAVLTYGFDVVGLHRISLGVYAFNPRARRVYERCGFVVEGTERDALRWNGRWVDQIRMAMLASDPRPW